MPQQTINIGAAPDDGTGDTLRVGGDKINDNFTELYAADAALGTAAPLDVDPDDTLAADSDSLIPTQQAVKAYVDANVGGSVAELDDVGDVNAPAPANGDVLTWDSTPGEWVAAAPTGGSNALDDLTDVDAPTPADGDVLTYDGANWVPGAGGGTNELDFGPPTLAILATERKTASSFTASASDVSGKGLRLSLNPTGINNKVLARLKAPPAAPFQIDIRFRQTPHNNGGEAGLILHNSSNGRNLRVFQLTTGQVYAQQWSALETYNADIAIGPTGIAFDLHCWLRVTVDGSGNVAFFHSCDGAYFKALGTTTLATYLTAAGGSFDEVGVYARANGSGGTSGATFHFYDES